MARTMTRGRRVVEEVDEATGTDGLSGNSSIWLVHMASTMSHRTMVAMTSAMPRATGRSGKIPS